MNCSECYQIDKSTVEKWSLKFRNWHYYPDFVIPPQPSDGMGFTKTDCPLVFQIEGDKKWYMFYTGFEGKGYRTMLASSDDLIHWAFEGLAMGYGKEGAYDYGGVTFGGALFKSYNLKDAHILKEKDGKFWILYGCYPKQGGYEIRPGAEGAAWSNDGFEWHRVSEDRPMLSIVGASEWEKDCIYQPWLLEHDNRYYDFYNAANGSREQTGVAFSDDLVNWERYGGNPIVTNGPSKGYDEEFCSDGKVFYDENHWVMFYFGLNKENGICHCHIMAAYSYDLTHWTKDPEPLYKAGSHPEGLDREHAHKVSIAYDRVSDTIYMYYTAVGVKGRGIGLLTSKPLEI